MADWRRAGNPQWEVAEFGGRGLGLLNRRDAEAQRPLLLVLCARPKGTRSLRFIHIRPLTPNSYEGPELDPERQRLARQYAVIRHRLFFAEMGVMVAGVLLLLLAGWSAGLRRWAESISPEPWIVVALYGVALGAAYTVLSLPLSYYSGYTLPRRYGLSVQCFRDWALDNLKELAISALLGLAGLELLYWLLRTFPSGGGY